MILVDANVLLYAYDSSSRFHGPCRAWLESALSGAEPIGLPWATILAFLRLTTNQRLLAQPLGLAEATAIVSSWLAQPAVQVVDPGEGHWAALVEVLEEAQAKGPLVSDAHLAAMAREYGATLATTDRDFRRFRGLRLLNPAES